MTGGKKDGFGEQLFGKLLKCWWIVWDRIVFDSVWELGKIGMRGRVGRRLIWWKAFGRYEIGWSLNRSAIGNWGEKMWVWGWIHREFSEIEDWEKFQRRDKGNEHGDWAIIRVRVTSHTKQFLQAQKLVSLKVRMRRTFGRGLVWRCKCGELGWRGSWRVEKRH